MKASICMAAFQRPELLRRTLESIYRQKVPFDFETIVCDDGGGLPEELLRDFPQVQWHRIDRVPTYRNPAFARNVTYRAARGEVLICQSEEVMHMTEDCIERLVMTLRPRTCLFAKVHALDPQGNPNTLVMGSRRGRRRPFFFLGSLFRSDMYAVGGNDEEFVDPGFEDKWLANCLVNGRGLTPMFSNVIVGHHQYHVPWLDIYRNHLLYDRKKHTARCTGIWMAASGPWNTES